VLEALPIMDNPVREQRLLAMQGRRQWQRSELLTNAQWQQTVTLIQQLSDHHA